MRSIAEFVQMTEEVSHLQGPILIHLISVGDLHALSVDQCRVAKSAIAGVAGRHAHDETGGIVDLVAVVEREARIGNIVVVGIEKDLPRQRGQKLSVSPVSA